METEEGAELTQKLNGIERRLKVIGQIAIGALGLIVYLVALYELKNRWGISDRFWSSCIALGVAIAIGTRRLKQGD